jgi:hypothetical protein
LSLPSSRCTLRNCFPRPQARPIKVRPADRPERKEQLCTRRHHRFSIPRVHAPFAKFEWPLSWSADAHHMHGAYVAASVISRWTFQPAALPACQLSENLEKFARPKLLLFENLHGFAKFDPSRILFQTRSSSSKSSDIFNPTRGFKTYALKGILCFVNKHFAQQNKNRLAAL